jgi:hypothetical protein
LSAGHRPKHRTPTLLPSASITHANAAPPQASSAPVAGYLRPCAHRRLPLLRCICKKSVLVAWEGRDELDKLKTSIPRVFTASSKHEIEHTNYMCIYG